MTHEPTPSSTHVVPVTDADRHETADDASCACTPFVYRLVVDGEVTGTEVRHNSFDALPVDEEALEKAQHAAG